MFLILTRTLFISKGIWLLPTQKIEKNPIFCLFTKSQNSPVESLTFPPRQLVSGLGGSVDVFWFSSSRCPYAKGKSRKRDQVFFLVNQVENKIVFGFQLGRRQTQSLINSYCMTIIEHHHLQKHAYRRLQQGFSLVNVFYKHPSRDDDA